MFKSLLGDGAFYFLGSVLSRGMGLVMFPIYAAKLVPADYAVVDLLNVFAAVCAVTLTLEIAQGFYREFNEHESEQQRVLTSTAFWFSIGALTLTISILTLFARPLAGLITGSADNVGATRLCLAVIWLTCLNYFGGCVLRLSLRAKSFLIVSVLQAVFAAAGTLIALYVFGLKAEGVFIGLGSGQIAGGIAIYAMIRRFIAPVFDVEKLKEMLRFSLPLIPSSVGVIATMYIDRIVVKQMMTLTDVGILGTAYRFASVASIITGAVSAAVTPLIYKHYKEETTPAQLNRIFEILAFVTVAVSLGAYAFTADFIRMLLPAAYHPASPIIPFLIFAAFLGQFYVVLPGLPLAKKTAVISAISIAGAVMNLGLNIFLVSKFGLFGVITATILSAIFVCAGYVFLGQRHYPLPFQIRRLCALVGVALLGGWIVRWLATSEPSGRFFWSLLVVTVAIAAAAWTIKPSLSRAPITPVGA